MEKTKSSPDEILEAINREERSAHRGKLKIFFGYAAGVGKTYAMPEAAHTALADGADIVSGYIEPHPRPQTAALLDGLEILPYKTIDYNGITLNEFDLDAAIKRDPQIIPVDELAHTNAAGCRHAKRYQDVDELLNAGIDVWTTVNVIEYSPNLDIYIIPDSAPAGAYRARKAKSGSRRHIAADCVKAAAVIAASTGIGYLFERFGIDVANIITVYIPGVPVISVLTSNRWFSLISSPASVVVFNFFLTDPRYTLNAYEPSYHITFIVMFLAAFITSNLAAKIKQSALTAYRTRGLFDTDKLLQKAETKSEAAAAAVCMTMLSGCSRTVSPGDIEGYDEGEQYISLWVILSKKLPRVRLISNRSTALTSVTTAGISRTLILSQETTAADIPTRLTRLFCR